MPRRGAPAAGWAGLNEVVTRRSSVLKIKTLAASHRRGIGLLEEWRMGRVRNLPGRGLWRSKADGTERMQLTFSPLSAFLPRWSPDEKQIAFAATTPGKPYCIYLISAEGGQPQQLTKGEPNEIDVGWSSDGGRLVFGSTGGAGDRYFWHPAAGFEDTSDFVPSQLEGFLLSSLVAGWELHCGHSSRSAETSPLRFQDAEVGGLGQASNRVPELVPRFEIRLL